MRFLFTYILFSLFALSVLGQNKIDSLEQVLKTSKAEEKAYIYYQLARKYYYKDVQQLTFYSKKTDSLAKIHEIDSLRVKSLNFLSYASVQSGKIQDAVSYNMQALDLATKKQLKKDIISSEFFKGYYLYAMGSTDSSLVQLKRTYNEAIKEQELILQLQCLNTIAANYLNQSEYKDALKNFTLAYQLADSLQLHDKKINLSLNIGTTLLYNEEIERAIEYFENVTTQSDTTDITLVYATALNNLGACYSNLGQHEKALIYFNKALPAYKAINNRLQIAQVYANLGQSSYFLGRNELASDYLLNAVKLNRESQSKNQLIVNLILLGELQTIQKKYIQAKISLNEAETLIKKYNVNSNKSDLFKVFSIYYSDTKNYKKALEYKQLELNIRNQNFKENRQKRITEIETKFETQLKENENEALRKDIALNNLEIERQNQIRNFLIVLALLVTILVFILLNRARIKRKSHLIIEKQKIELEKANNTKDKFFSIIAHDLKSPFSALLGFSELLATSYDDMDDKERKSFINDLHTASQSTYSLVENLLTWSRIQQGNLAMTKEKIDIFNVIANGILANQSTAKLKNITINNNISSHDTVWVNKFSIETIIGNLVSNAIKFTPEKGSIDISTEEKNGMLIVSIIDTGVGMTSEQVQNLFKIDKNISTSGTNNETGTGLGLILCKEFIEQNDGSIWVKSELGKGSIFSFSVPIYK